MVFRKSVRQLTLLVTGSINNIATMPCNPSIGGSAKGIVVREIDALGGYMGKCADKTLLQQKMLNKSKGPAVKSLRCQADKVTYPQEMLRHLKEQENLTIKEGMAYATIVWSSKNYDYMIVDDEKYMNENNGGSSTFTFPLSSLPCEINVVGDTTAMSTPHEIDYTLTFSQINE